MVGTLVSHGEHHNCDDDDKDDHVNCHDDDHDQHGGHNGTYEDGQSGPWESLFCTSKDHHEEKVKVFTRTLLPEG